MIVSSLLDLFFSLMLGLFSGLDFVGLPLSWLNGLQNILAYGVWIVGADLMAVFISVIAFWWIFKFIGEVFFIM